MISPAWMPLGKLDPGAAARLSGAIPKPDDLVPRAFKGIPLAQFMRKLPRPDAEWAERARREAVAAG